tara:strand:- start:1310 stop:3553 length:2244 start_codon:yes stop_codon:yes gene_type:complete
MTSSSSSGNIRQVSLNEAMGERYLSYALSTITARSLPDVRDGLKPVQRRILYAMKESGNTSEKPYRKSASAVGYVMMKYHPHGNDPIYEAMVRMAQDFSSRYPLIEGQGNFGSLDGDNAAAMRYTEARLSAPSMALLEGIDENAVDFQDTYNGETQEPSVLPSSFPNLLANGASGIAVGMATNIPPHNVGEICDALLALLKKASITTAELLSFMPGPDFPTGGILVEKPDAIHKAYETGRGGLRLRARYEVESLKGSQYQIVVTEIPYQVQKGRLIEKLADLWTQKKLPLLADIRDESTTDVRLVLVPRSRTVDPVVLMESLYKMTELETRFHLNMNVLDQGKVPRVLSLKQVLQAFLDHRQEVLCRRAQNRLNQIARRLEILEGFMVAYLNIEEVIRIIRFDETPKETLMKRWSLSDLQAESILNMKLRALRKLEEIQIRQEHEGLLEEQKTLQNLLSDEKSQWKSVGQQIRDIKKRFGSSHPFGLRRTTLEEAPEVTDIPLEAMIEREPVTVVCSEKGWIRSLKGHQTDDSDLRYKEGDKGKFILRAETTDKVLIFTSNGRFFTLGIDKLPGGRGHGDPLRLMIDLDPAHDIIDMRIAKTSDLKDQRLLVVASDGRGFIVATKDVMAQTKSGKQILNVEGRVRAAKCLVVEGDGVAIVGNNRKLLVFPVEEIPQMTRGRGVILQRYREGRFSDVTTFVIAEGLSWPMSGATDRIRHESDIWPWLGRRSQSGRMAPNGFPRTNTFG